MEHASGKEAERSEENETTNSRSACAGVSARKAYAIAKALNAEWF